MPTEDEPLHQSREQNNPMEWGDEFIAVTDPNTSTGRLIYSFVGRELYNFHLESRFSRNYVLNEVFLRGHAQLRRGYQIKNPNAWIKGTAYRVIRELARADRNLESLTECEVYESSSCSEEEIWAEHFAALREAITRISPLEQRLLNLKIVEGKSWIEIQAILRIEGHGDLNVAAWRKRKERALTSLRKAYHQIKPFF